ncbi:MAG: hypothetical protein H3C68_01560 [Deltaproteobacteria bacterium]|nr:hypothetical protein [Deltaproteobacteria bacterium]MBZ0219058.1 hypothetical protein [Deltaproteobacteria bacterium]
MDTEIGTALAKGLNVERFYDSFFLGEYGRLETARAKRYNAQFSLVALDLGEGAIEAGLIEGLATGVVAATRDCDVAGLYDGSRVIVILPETDYFGAAVTARKLAKALDGLEDCRNAVITHATFPRDGRAFRELAGAAIRRAEEKKASIWEKEGLGKKLFWEILGELTSRNYKGYEYSSFDAGAGQDLSEFFLDQVNELIIREIAGEPARRGIMYYAAKSLSSSLPVVKNLGSAGQVATKVFLVGEGEGSIWDVRNALPLLLDDPRLRETFFTFFLNEETAYAIICKENWGATFSCFHTSDFGLVEGLITKFQQEYSLQEQLG